MSTRLRSLHGSNFILPVTSKEIVRYNKPTQNHMLYSWFTNLLFLIIAVDSPTKRDDVMMTSQETNCSACNSTASPSPTSTSIQHFTSLITANKSQSMTASDVTATNLSTKEAIVIKKEVSCRVHNTRRKGCFWLVFVSLIASALAIGRKTNLKSKLWLTLCFVVS